MKIVYPSNTLYTSTINKKNGISLEFDASGSGFEDFLAAFCL